jgi:hypothetical protein
MRHSHPDGNSIFGSPVYILDTPDCWQPAIKSIQQKWKFISMIAEIVSNTDPPEISVISTYCLNGPVYIFDLLSVGIETSRKLIKQITESKEIFKVVFNLEELANWLWRGLQCKVSYVVDALTAYNISSELVLTHKISISNFCSWIGKVSIPFMQDILQESSNPLYWKRRPLIYIMQCYLSGTVSVLMKAWLDIRVGLSDDQVHSIFNLSEDTAARVAGEIPVLETKFQPPVIIFKSLLANFSFDKLSIYQAFDKVFQTIK